MSAMFTVSTSTARKDLADILSRAVYAQERTVVTRYGKPVVTIVSMEDLEAISEEDVRMSNMRRVGKTLRCF